ncbi:MAG: Bax inhibitor-1/YccA family protein [Acidimicrobiales bacterium]
MTVAASAGVELGSGNPAFGEQVVGTYLGPARTETTAATMTVSGTVVKTFLFLVVLVAGGSWGWASATDPVATDLGSGYGNTTVTIPGGFWLASIGAFFVGFVLIMNPRRAALFGFVYALLEGYVLGAISAMYDAQTEGIVGAAVLSTVCVFLVALLLYVTRIIRPTQRMAFGVTAAIGGLCMLYLFVAVMSIFNWGWLYSDQFRTIGFIITLVSIVLAALSLTLDFAMIESGVASGAPRFMEWYCAYGLMVTLIWLYITLLRLLAMLSRNNN